MNYGQSKKNNYFYFIEYFIRLGNGTLQDKESDGSEETVELLSSLDISQSYTNLQLIWEFSKWILTKNPEQGVKVLSIIIFFSNNDRSLLLVLDQLKFHQNK